MTPNSTFANVALGTGDTSKALIAAPSTGYCISVLVIHWDITTAAAQAVSVGDGTSNPLKFAASASGNGTRRFGSNGMKLAAATALTATPAAAGPAINFVIEYTILPS